MKLGPKIARYNARKLPCLLPRTRGVPRFEMSFVEGALEDLIMSASEYVSRGSLPFLVSNVSIGQV